MDPRYNFESLLEMAKNNYQQFSQLSSDLDNYALNDSQRHELYLAATKANAEGFQLVPARYVDEEIIIAYILREENKTKIMDFFSQLPPRYGTYNILVNGCRQNIELLSLAHKNWGEISSQFNFNKEQSFGSLCLDVAKVNWRAMRFYPGVMIEDKIIQQCKLDVSKDWREIVYVPEYLLEDQYFHPSLIKVRQAIIDGELKPTLFMSQRILDENVCMSAITRDVGNFDAIPIMLRTRSIFRAVIKVSPDFLRGFEMQENRPGLTESEYIDLCREAKDIHGIKKTFHYLPPDLKTYETCVAAAKDNAEVLKYLKTPNDRKMLSQYEYDDLCLLIVKNHLGEIAPELKNNKAFDEILMKFIRRYESINKLKNYAMEDIKTFFSNHFLVISNLYKIFGINIFILMEKMLLTSADSLNRFLTGLENFIQSTDVYSKNISRLLDNLDYKNAEEKAPTIQQYLLLSKDDKQKINVLIDKDNISAIPQAMRELLINKFYDYLKLSYEKKNNVLDTLSYEQLANLCWLFEHHKRYPDTNNSKIFFSMLRVYLSNMPFQLLHQPEEMMTVGDDYMAKMAVHNKKLREDLAAGGVDVAKALAYKKQVPLVFDEYQKQKIMDILANIYRKLKDATEKSPEGINKNIKNLLVQIEKGKDDQNKKLLRMLSSGNLVLLKRIAEGIFPSINADYLELLKLTKDVSLDTLVNYQPRKFHIEMWDKSKIGTLFLGDYLGCCLSTTGMMAHLYSPRVFDDAILTPVIIDETTSKPVCGTWLVLAKVSKPINKQKIIDVVSNGFEINAGLAENRALMNYLIVNLVTYIEQFTDSIHAAEAIMLPTVAGMLVPDLYHFGAFTATNARNTEKVGGFFGDYYLNAVGNNIYYQLDQTKFSTELKTLISPELNKQRHASSMTLGFIGTKEDSLTKDHPAPDQVNLSK